MHYRTRLLWILCRGFALRLTPSWSGSRPGMMLCTKLRIVRLYGTRSQMRLRRDEWAANGWILRHALSFYLLRTFPHCLVSPTFLCQSQQSQRCCWQQVQPLISWHPFIPEGVKQMELQSDGRDLSWTARSSRWRGNKQVRCL